jgi:hypothetical protein
MPEAERERKAQHVLAARKAAAVLRQLRRERNAHLLEGSPTA